MALKQRKNHTLTPLLEEGRGGDKNHDIIEEERIEEEEEERDNRGVFSIVFKVSISIGIIVLLLAIISNNNNNNATITTTATKTATAKVDTATTSDTTATTITETASSAKIDDKATTTKEMSNNDNSIETSTTPLFADTPGHWVSKDKLKSVDEEVVDFKSDYIWIPKDDNEDTTKYQFIHSKSTTVAMQGHQITKSFKDLSNYEVVCWIGDDGASKSHSTFLQLRPSIAQSQRPFKFHYKPITDLSFLEKDVNTDANQNPVFRKCKQSFVFFDDKAVEGISQHEYITSVRHLLKEIHDCMHDDTWSIWMMTYNGDSKNACHSPTITKDDDTNKKYHPCNAALFDLFQNNEDLGKNVDLMDHTDITSSSLTKVDTMEIEQKDIIATITMRLFGIISNQVSTWRKAGQIGKKDGLHRNGKVEEDAATICQFTNVTTTSK